MNPTNNNIENYLDYHRTVRLENISEMRNILVIEEKNRRRISKKYHQVSNILEGSSTFLSTISIIGGAGAVATLSMFVTIPLAAILSASSAVTSSLCLGLRLIGRKLSNRAKKHDRISILARSKKNSIDVLVSRALIDNDISVAEFESVVEEMSRYEELKNDIRAKARATMPKIENTDWGKFKLQLGTKVNARPTTPPIINNISKIEL